MNVEKGMIFKGKINGREIEVVEANSVYVKHREKYRDGKYGTVFTVGRKMFEHCLLERIK